MQKGNIELKVGLKGHCSESYIQEIKGLTGSNLLRSCLLFLALTLLALSISNLWAIYVPSRTLFDRLLHSAVSSALTFGIVPFVFTYLQIDKGCRKDFLGLKPINIPSLSFLIKLIVASLVGFGLIALTSYVSNILIEHWSGTWGDYLRALQKQAESIAFFIKQPTTLSLSIFRILVISLLTGFVEELYMRGTLQPLLIRLTKSSHWGIVLTAIIFALLHLSPAHLLPIFIYGLIFGYWRHYTGSLYPGIILHVSNNLLTLLLP